jgi:hypothetical protein
MDILAPLRQIEFSQKFRQQSGYVATFIEDKNMDIGTKRQRDKGT